MTRTVASWAILCNEMHKSGTDTVPYSVFAAAIGDMSQLDGDLDCVRALSTDGPNYNKDEREAVERERKAFVHAWLRFNGDLAMAEGEAASRYQMPYQEPIIQAPVVAKVKVDIKQEQPATSGTGCTCHIRSYGEIQWRNSECPIHGPLHGKPEADILDGLEFDVDEGAVRHNMRKLAARIQAPLLKRIEELERAKDGKV